MAAQSLLGTSKPALAGPTVPSEPKSERYGTRGPILAGMVVVALMFGGIGTWGAIAELAKGVRATAQVRIQTERQSVQHLEGGIIDRIFVEENDFVERGDVLIRLDEVQTLSSLEASRSRLENLLIEEARIGAELKKADQILYPDEIMARLDDPRVVEQIAEQEEIFAARKRELDGEKELLLSRIDQLQESIEGYDAQIEANRRQLDLISEELSGLTGLLERGFVQKPRVLALQRTQAAIEGEIAELASVKAQTQVRVGETELNIAQTDRAIRRQSLDRLQQIRANKTQLRSEITALQDRLTRLDVFAPVTGTVISLEVHTEGGVIRPGQELMQIVPSSDHYRFEARVPTKDIETVTPGTPVEVKITSLGGGGKLSAIVPMMHGEVVEVGADAIQDERSGAYFYRVVTEVPAEEMKKLGHHRIVPGMEAQLLMTSGTRTPIEFLFDPFLKIFEEGMVAP